MQLLDLLTLITVDMKGFVRMTALLVYVEYTVEINCLFFTTFTKDSHPGWLTDVLWSLCQKHILMLVQKGKGTKSSSVK